MFTAVTVHKMTETEDENPFSGLDVQDQGEFLRLDSATDGAATGHILE